MKFALLGAAGYVAPRHMEAICGLGHELVAAMDPHDSVGVLDRYAPDCRFFTEFERFDRFIRKNPVDWVSICSPSHLHSVHIWWGLERGARVICEKPATLNPANTPTGDVPVFIVHQLRFHPAIRGREVSGRVQAEFQTTTPRGPWYDWSWKGDESKSGGLEMNIGVHLFDLMLHLFGDCREVCFVERSPRRSVGCLDFERADVTFDLSIDGAARRSISMDGESLDLSGMEGLHREVYRGALAGEGVRLPEALRAVELARAVQSGRVSAKDWEGDVTTLGSAARP